MVNAVPCCSLLFPCGSIVRNSCPKSVFLLAAKNAFFLFKINAAPMRADAVPAVPLRFLPLATAWKRSGTAGTAVRFMSDYLGMEIDQ